ISSSILLRCPHSLFLLISLFFFNVPPTTEIYTLSLHDALPISLSSCATRRSSSSRTAWASSSNPGTSASAGPRQQVSARVRAGRSEEHTSELQSRSDLVCRLLLEKKKKKTIMTQKIHQVYEIY